MNLMRMADMLSIPYYPPLSFATSSFNNSSTVDIIFFSSLSLFCTHLTISSEDLLYQIPSQPMIIKSTFYLEIFFMSGFAVIICSQARHCGLFLYSKSPKALDRFKFPFTLPQVTHPPAFSILFFSSSLSGLWSQLNYQHLPLILATARESPEFATQICVSVIRQTLAVHPACDSQSNLVAFSISLICFCISLIYCLPASDFKSSSIFRKVSLRAFSYN